MLLYCKLQHLACTKTLAQRPQRPQLPPSMAGQPTLLHALLPSTAFRKGQHAWQLLLATQAALCCDGMCTHTISRCDVLAQHTFRSWYALPALIDSLLGV
jgi:hypothetical protein